MSQDSDPFDEDYQADDAEEAEDDHMIDSSDEYGGVTSGGEDDPEGDYFAQDINPHDLLKDMAMPTPGDGSSLQPYQILRAISSGPKRRKTKRRGGAGRQGPRQMDLPEHVSRMVGHANLLYASNKYQQAIDLLLEVIRQVPNLADPYNTLGVLHEVLGEPRKALDFYMIAAHMTGKDVDLWHKLAVMSDEQGFHRQAIYCWNRYLYKDKDNFEARLARARLFPLVNEPWKAKQQYTWLLDKHPGQPEVVKALVTLCHDLNETDKAVELLEGQLANHYDQVDLTHINMLADLYMATGHYANAVQLINRSERVMCQEEPLPIDLKVRRGTCYAYMGDIPAASADLQQLLEHPVIDDDGDSYEDLYLLVIQEVGKLGMAQVALPFMDRLKGELYVDGGETEAASALLAALDQNIQQQNIILPEGQRQQMSLFLVQARLQLLLGLKEEFAAGLLPRISALLDVAESNMAIVDAAKKLVRALKRRKMFARRGGRKGEGDEEATAAQGDDDAALPAELRALALAAAADQEDQPDLFKDSQLYGVFIELIHVLVELGKEQQAAALLTRASAVGAYPTTSRDNSSWWGPSAAAVPPRKPGSRRGNATDAGAVSDGGGVAAAAAAGGVLSGNERREEARLMREALRLLSAEIHCRQGDVEEALKQLKTVAVQLAGLVAVLLLLQSAGSSAALDEDCGLPKGEAS
eukprot:gene2357-2663_t